MYGCVCLLLAWQSYRLEQVFVADVPVWIHTEVTSHPNNVPRRKSKCVCFCFRSASKPNEIIKYKHFSLVFVYVKPSVFIHYNSTHTCSLTYILLLYLPHSVLRFRLPQCDPQGLLHFVGIKRCSITQFSVSASRRCIFADFGARIVSSNAVIQGVVLECCCS